MSLPYKIITIAAMLIIVSSVLYGEDTRRELYWFSQQSQTRYEADQTLIWQQKIPPAQAAKLLLDAVDFMPHSITFAPALQLLCAQLQQIATAQDTTWQDCNTAVFDRMERYLALFRMLQKNPAPAGSLITILGVAVPDHLPFTDRRAYPGSVSPHPCWQTAGGKLFSTALIALPRRAGIYFQAAASPVQQLDGSNQLPAPHLMAVRYSYKNDRWQVALQPAADANFAGMQVYWLQIAIPPDAPPGNYLGSINMQPESCGQPEQLFYSLEVINPAPGALPGE